MNFKPQLKTILQMLNGDKDALKRLVDRVSQANPGRSAQWCLDKVQWDLERDRGYR